MGRVHSERRTVLCRAGRGNVEAANGLPLDGERRVNQPDIPGQRLPGPSTKGLTMRRLFTLVATLALTLAIAAPALAQTGAGGAGSAYGQHHAMMAQEMGGFSGDMNPGVMHKGFSGWMGM